MCAKYLQRIKQVYTFGTANQKGEKKQFRRFPGKISRPDYPGRIIAKNPASQNLAKS